MKKIWVFLIGLFSVLCLSTNVRTVKAANVDEVPVSLNYDLVRGGTQQTIGTDENGDDIILKVSEDLSMLRMANKTYTISKSGGGWRVSYKVKVVSNKITSVSNLNAVATVGSFSSSSLRKISALKAQWHAVHQIGIIKTNVYCTATVSGQSLHIS